jgi:hypothetical protein
MNKLFIVAAIMLSLNSAFAAISSEDAGTASVVVNYIDQIVLNTHEAGYSGPMGGVKATAALEGYSVKSIAYMKILSGAACMVEVNMGRTVVSMTLIEGNQYTSPSQAYIQLLNICNARAK